MRKLLRFLFIIQEKEKFNPLGHHHYVLRRWNPYNPLSYLIIVFILLVSLVLFGLVGVWKEIDFGNPFKYK